MVRNSETSQPISLCSNNSCYIFFIKEFLPTIERHKLFIFINILVNDMEALERVLMPEEKRVSDCLHDIQIRNPFILVSSYSPTRVFNSSFEAKEEEKYRLENCLKAGLRSRAKLNHKASLKP
jgi:hypothetical protein